MHCWSTHGKALSHAKWQPLYQDDRGTYATGDDRHGDAVIDQIPVEEDEWVLHYDVRMSDSQRIAKRTRRQLTDLAVTHHRLGHIHIPIMIIDFELSTVS